MIIVGAYPKSIIRSDIQSPLGTLYEVATELPPGIALHILPFGPADGDGGFASTDWFKVDPTFGTWEDVRRLARQRRIIIDGIYNHVGLNHQWCREWTETGAGAERLHVFPFRPSQRVLSPRGGSVFVPHSVQGDIWWAWQTFSSRAIDVQLANGEVQAAIQQHQALIAELGVWGIRLDSVAYYGKKLGERQRHHPLGIQYARDIVANAQKYGFKILPQLNCDSWGRRYFSGRGSFDAPLTDFAYSAALILAILTGRPGSLISHVNRMLRADIPVLRALRSHDGILLKTSLLKESERRMLVTAFEEHEVSPRVIEGRPYEFNSSFPFSCTLGTTIEGMWRRIKIAIAITAFLPGVCYIYLPILYGFRPEQGTDSGPKTDPRGLNRIPMLEDFVANVATSIDHKSVIELLRVLDSLNDEFNIERLIKGDSIEQLGDSGIIIRRIAGRLVLVANLAKERLLSLPGGLGRLLVGEGVNSGLLDPLGFGLWIQ